MRLPEIHDSPGRGIGTVMTNFDHSIKDKAVELLADGDCYGLHAGWNFNANVWAVDGGYMSRVHVSYIAQASFFSPTLQELMREHNDEFGDE